VARLGPRAAAGPRGRGRRSDPDTLLYAGRNRLYLSRDGGRFWHALAVELPEIEAVALSAG
jgi:hypothetical protein